MTVFIDDTQADFEKLIQADIGANTTNRPYTSHLIDWIHYRARRVPQRPRSVIWSPHATSASATHTAIHQIASALSAGADVGPWLSKSIVDKKDKPKADLMFNDWQIIHFHLGNVFENPNHIKRTGDLLFAYVATNRAVLLDVKPHGAWTMLELLRTLLQTSPEDMERAEINGIVGLQHSPTDDEIMKLRSNGVSTMFELDGRFFMSPGFGVSTSGHATRLVIYVNRMMRNILDLKETVEKDKLPRHLQQHIFGTIGIPVRLGVRIDGGDFSFYDKNRNLDLMGMSLPE